MHSTLSKVFTSGKHSLEFKFGNDVGYAFNSALPTRGTIISVSNAGGDPNTDGADVEVEWGTQDILNQVYFAHDTLVNNETITVLEDGVYRVSYGLYVTQTDYK
jgi:hypothetical protein